jgi:tRNA dimethylallyltransferase
MSQLLKRQCIFLFGPTGSGKTSLSIFLAQKLNGVIINADSRQVYREMPILTAMPTQEEFNSADHRLFEFLEPCEKITVDKYSHLAKEEIEKIWDVGQLPIVCGGTGFYLKVLEEGIAPIPVLEKVHLDVLNEQAQVYGSEKLYRKLQEVDPLITLKLKPHDTQRVIRALGVYMQTGKTMTFWQEKPKKGGIDSNVLKIALNPEREWLYDRIHDRYQLMLDMGLMDEIKLLLDKGIEGSMHALQSCGAKDLIAYHYGDITENMAKEALLQSTRNYAKRQFTWLKGQFNPDIVFESVAHAQNALDEIKVNLNKN